MSGEPKQHQSQEDKSENFSGSEIKITNRDHEISIANERSGTALNAGDSGDDSSDGDISGTLSTGPKAKLDE